MTTEVASMDRADVGCLASIAKTGEGTSAANSSILNALDIVFFPITSDKTA